MTVSREEATSLVNQVQASHRLLAGFYKRLLPTLDEMAAKFGAAFWFWEPINFDRPCRSSTKPSSKWAWDFLPLLNADFAYARTDQDQQAVLHFQIHTDPSLLRSNRQTKGQPDPLKLLEATPVVRIYAFWLVEGSIADIKEQWHTIEFPQGEASSLAHLNSEVLGTWWEMGLAELVAEPQETEAAISKFISRCA